MHLSMLSPTEGGGGGGRSNHRNLIVTSVPRVGILIVHDVLRVGIFFIVRDRGLKGICAP